MIPLRQPCDYDDICKDENAECNTRICMCMDEYYESSGQCSMYDKEQFVYNLLQKNYKELKNMHMKPIISCEASYCP